MLTVLFLPGLSHGHENDKHFTLKGNVSGYSTRETLTGVNVYIKGTTTGTVTNERGYYSLEAPAGKQTIVFSFIGYKTLEKEVTLSADKTLNIRLEPSEELLGEVQITAQRRFFGNMEYGRELPSINAEAISKQNSGNASDILHARVAGVWATKTSGAPGDQQKIRIRGQTSFFSSAEPLYVIDGVPVPIVNLASLGIGDLNVHDIENVTILKDASSSSLYGFQGGNGVILIDTKKSTANKLTFSAKTGYQWFDNYYDLMGTKDFLESLDMAQQTIKSNIRKRYPEYTPTLCDHNRQDEIFRSGLSQEYQLSGSGKAGPIGYYASGNYTNQTGIIENTGFERYTFLTHLSTNIRKKLAIDVSYRCNYQENINNQNEYMGNQVIMKGIAVAPCLECTPDSLLYNSDRELFQRTLTRYDLLNGLDTPQNIIDRNNHSYNFFSHAGSFMGHYRFNDKLSFNVIESFMARNSVYKAATIFNQITYKYYNGTQSVNMKSEESVLLLNHQASLSYNNTFGQHGVNFLLAHRYYADNLHWQVDSLENTLPEHYYLRNSMAGYGTKGSVIRKIGSYIAHCSYNYQQKYFVSAIANLSRIQEGLYIDYYNLFPSLSISWDMAKEPFMAGSFIDELNLYANYGESGNYPLNGLSNNIYENIPNTFSDSTSTHPYVSQLANRFLQHESTAEIDVGLKSSFLNQRIKLNAAYFFKKIGNQIIQRDIPYYYGGGKAYINLGNIEVKGYEFDIEATPVETKHINWKVKGNFSVSKQKVTKLADNQNMLFKSDDMLFPNFIISQNGSLGDIYAFKYLGKWTKEDEDLNDIRYMEKFGIKYLNVDTIGTGVVDDDKTVVGNSIPDFNWNLISSLQYKEFSLDFTVYSSWGMQKFNATRAGTMLTGVNREVNQLYADSLRGINFFYFYESSFFVEDAGFIRLKNITLGYEPTKKILGVNCRFSLSFENLYTYTKYKGYDPEATIFTDNNFSDNAVDRGAYPNPKSVYFSIEIKL
ncbi:MAG: SusC/RagA family TonB-linked outer membrane protein [Prolixibacteraceae bacterium]|nr:SusC/RagA family TonB-linked outer membrane protein [Prolixibacteraceae bacterium]